IRDRTVTGVQTCALPIWLSFLMFLLLFRLPMSDQVICVMLLLIIRTGVAYMTEKMVAAKNIYGLAQYECTECQPTGPQIAPRTKIGRASCRERFTTLHVT